MMKRKVISDDFQLTDVENGREIKSIFFLSFAQSRIKKQREICSSTAENGI